MSDQDDQDRLALVSRIKAWRDDDRAGYDQAIELLCDAEAEVTRLTQENERLKTDYRESVADAAQALAGLQEENARLKADLLTEWQINHTERCGAEGCDGRARLHAFCGWMLPESLAVPSA